MSYHRCKERHRRLKKLYAFTKNYYGCGAYYDAKKHRYVRYSVGRSGYKKYLKRKSNKKVRKAKCVNDYCDYKKLYDYWWTLF